MDDKYAKFYVISLGDARLQFISAFIYDTRTHTRSTMLISPISPLRIISAFIIVYIAYSDNISQTDIDNVDKSCFLQFPCCSNKDP